MKKYLLFRLYGPMCSWGDIAVGETRPGFAHPTKSAILGMVAAALGIKREEDEKHKQLAESYAFAVLVEDMGIPLVDYHTAQVPPGKERYFTRKDELTLIPKNELKTILSTRDYRVDAIYSVALCERKQNEWSVELLQEALSRPVFTLYLGRKSCPLALLFQPQIVEKETLRDAFQSVQFVKLSELVDVDFPPEHKKILYWEKDQDSGIPEEHIFERRDIPLSRQRWQFDVRKEYHAAFI